MIKTGASAVVMVRPSHFYPNPETAADNAFQCAGEVGRDYSVGAQAEFDAAVSTLHKAGITVHSYTDTPSPDKPDAVFPNNWFTTHRDGRVALYPMSSPSRRAERRLDIIDSLRESYRVTKVVDYSGYETRGLYLEGTGSLVLDRVHRLAYVALSSRSHLQPLRQFCADFDYEPVTFSSVDSLGRPIYHTNVVLCIGAKLALIGLESIADKTERRTLRARLESTGKTIVDLALDQIESFAGNALELHNEQRTLLILSTRAMAALSDDQIGIIAPLADLVPLSLPTIELAGGSARCMLAEIYLPRRDC